MVTYIGRRKVVGWREWASGVESDLEVLRSRLQGGITPSQLELATRIKRLGFLGHPDRSESVVDAVLALERRVGSLSEDLRRALNHCGLIIESQPARRVIKRIKRKGGK